MVLPKKKQFLAKVLGITGISQFGLWLQKVCFSPFIRVVNYHSTPEQCRDSFRRQLEFYQEHFVPVGYDDLLQLHNGKWDKTKPGLLLTFDDGFLNHAEVAAPLLEEFGFIGWFFVPVGFIDRPSKQQVAFAKDHRISKSSDLTNTGRLAMSWEQLRRLARRHVVGCHTHNHIRLSKEISEQVLHEEIVLSKQLLEAKLKEEVRTFCWVGGEEGSYSKEAADMVRTAGYQLGFMTNNAPIRPHQSLLQLQRTNIEADWSLDVVRFAISGLQYLLYARKRTRVNLLTAPS